MAKILTEKEFHNILESYYKEHYGMRDTDEWYTNPALNVWVFKRDNKIITLKCHMLNGKVTEYVDSL